MSSPTGGPLNADLSLTQSDSPDPVKVGNDLTYSLEVTNSGFDDAPNVVITDRLPDGVTFVSASSGCTESAGTVRCNLGDLADGATRTVEIVVTPQAVGTITNTATVQSDALDPFPPDNSDRERTEVVTNRAPVAQNDTYSVTEDNTLTVGAPGVLANDSDVDGDALTAMVVQDPTDGTLDLDEDDDSFTYTPDANFTGSDAFTYKAKDVDDAQSNEATVSINVRATNDAPTANDDIAQTEKNTPVRINVVGNDLDIDGDRLTVTEASDPPNGTTSVNSDKLLAGTLPEVCVR